MGFAEQLAARDLTWINEFPAPGYNDPTLLPGADDDVQAAADFLATQTVSHEPVGLMAAAEIEGFVSELAAWGDAADAPGGESALILLAYGTTQCLIVGGDPNELLTPAEVGTILKIGSKAARGLIAESKNESELIPAMSISERRWLVRRGDLDEWLAGRLTGKGEPDAKPTGLASTKTQSEADGPPLRVYHRRPRKR